MKKIAILVTVVLGSCSLNAQEVKKNHKIKIDDFEFGCDKCTIEELLKEAEETYWEAVADGNNSDNWHYPEVNQEEMVEPSPIKMERVIVNKPNLSKIKSEENCRISLDVKIDVNGNIIGTPIVDRESTTTYDSKLINEVIAVIKQEVKYTPLPGAYIEKKKLTIQVRAN